MSFPSRAAGVLLAVASLAPALPAQAAPATTQVWTAAALDNGGTSAAVAVTSDDPVFTVYFKPTIAVASSYSVYLQASPDGANWSTVKDHVIVVPANGSAGIVYAMTVTVKAAKVRLVAFPSREPYATIVNGWITH